jgi:hypothetical protein
MILSIGFQFLLVCSIGSPLRHPLDYGNADLFYLLPAEVRGSFWIFYFCAMFCNYLDINRGARWPGKKDLSNPKSYRCISLVSGISKLTEKAVAQYLCLEGECRGWWHPTQFGSRPGRNTADALMWLKSIVAQNRDENVFFDSTYTAEYLTTHRDYYLHVEQSVFDF